MSNSKPPLKITLTDTQRDHLGTIMARIGAGSLAKTVQYLIMRDLDGTILGPSQIAKGSVSVPNESRVEWKPRHATYADYCAECKLYGFEPQYGQLNQTDWMYCFEHQVDGPIDLSDMWSDSPDWADISQARKLLAERDGKPWRPEGM